MKKNSNFVQTCLVQGEKENREKFSGEDGTQEELEDNFAERIYPIYILWSEKEKGWHGGEISGRRRR